MCAALNAMDKITRAAQLVVANLQLGEFYNINIDAFQKRESVTAEQLRKACEFGLKVANGESLPGFDSWADAMAKANESDAEPS